MQSISKRSSQQTKESSPNAPSSLSLSSSSSFLASNLSSAHGKAEQSEHRGILISCCCFAIAFYFSVRCYLEVTSNSGPSTYSVVSRDQSSTMVLLTTQSLESSSAYGYEKASLLSSVCLENKRMFAELNDLHFVVGTPSAGETEVAPRLLKVKWILELFRQGYEKVFYMDLDTLFLDPTVNIVSMMQSFNHWIGVTLDYNYYTFRKVRKSNIRGYAKDTRDVRRYNTGVLLTVNSKQSNEFFQKIYTEGRKNEADVSDQELFNRFVHTYFDEKNFLVLDRSIYNAFPLISDKRFRAMHPFLSFGDEKNGSTLIVHFAGIFGGSTEEKGKADPLALLLMYKEVVERHSNFLAKLSIDHRSILGIDENFANKRYGSSKDLLKNCVETIFQDVDNERAEKNAIVCLKRSVSLKS